ncbi:MAG: hypothetical protein ACOWWR_17435 [Eubacteriales bacterium]
MPNIKEHILNFKSPIRWGFLGLFIAIILFCIEIWLSLIQVYLSLYGGDIEVWDIVQPLLVTGLIIFALISLFILGLMIYSVILWRKYKSTDDTLQKTISINKDLKVIYKDIKAVQGEISDIKNSVNNLKRELGNQEELVDGESKQ